MTERRRLTTQIEREIIITINNLQEHPPPPLDIDTPPPLDIDTPIKRKKSTHSLLGENLFFL